MTAWSFSMWTIAFCHLSVSSTFTIIYTFNYNNNKYVLPPTLKTTIITGTQQRTLWANWHKSSSSLTIYMTDIVVKNVLTNMSQIPRSARVLCNIALCKKYCKCFHFVWFFYNTLSVCTTANKNSFYMVKRIKQ